MTESGTTEKTEVGDGRWPEQDMIHAWVEKHKCLVTPRTIHELANDMTKKRMHLENEIRHLKILALPWYLRNKEGWPIGHYEGKRFKTFMRILLQNIRKLTG